MKFYSLPEKPYSPDPESPETPEDQYIEKYTDDNSKVTEMP
jgi:hypothetical protein